MHAICQQSGYLLIALGSKIKFRWIPLLQRCAGDRLSELKIPDGSKMAGAALSRRAIDGPCAVM